MNDPNDPQPARRRLVPAAAAACALVAAAFGIVAWRTAAEDLDRRTEVLRAEADDARRQGEARLLQATAEAIAAGAVQQAEALDALRETLRAAHAGERGASQARLDEALAVQEALREENRALALAAQAGREDVARLAGDLSLARAEGARRITENARLLERVLASDRRLQGLQAEIAGLASSSEARAQPSIVSTQAAGAPGLPARLGAALREAGVEGLRVLEAVAAPGGLRAILIHREEGDGAAPRLLAAESAVLALARGEPVLRLRGVSATPAGGGEPSSEPDLEIALRGFDPVAWTALGLAAPEGWEELHRLRTALSRLVAAQGYRLVRLEGRRDDELLGLELSQDDEHGEPIRTVRAERGIVRPIGPSLDLLDGSITTGAEVRPFFHGLLRLPLGDADFGAWLAALGGATAGGPPP